MKSGGGPSLASNVPREPARLGIQPWIQRRFLFPIANHLLALLQIVWVETHVGRPGTPILHGETRVRRHRKLVTTLRSQENECCLVVVERLKNSNNVVPVAGFKAYGSTMEPAICPGFSVRVVPKPRKRPTRFAEEPTFLGAQRSRLIASRRSFKKVRPAGAVQSCDGWNPRSNGEWTSPFPSSHGYSQLSGRWPLRSIAGLSTSISLDRRRTEAKSPRTPRRSCFMSRINCSMIAGSGPATDPWLV